MPPAVAHPRPPSPPDPTATRWQRLWRRGQTPGERGDYPWIFIMVAAAAIVVQLAGTLHPSWGAALIYDRHALETGQWWRLWTGHLVHYGWLHFTADTAILLYLGRVITWPHPRARWLALLILPPVISATVYFFDPAMIYYAGLSALNFGLFVFLALQLWRRAQSDWLWPAVLLVCLGELVFESLRGGSGGGLIAFSDPSVRIATVAHIAGGVCGVALWLVCRPSRPSGSVADRQANTPLP